MASSPQTLPDARRQAIEARALRLGLSPEALLKAGVDALLSTGDRALDEAMRKVIDKNADLYRRLP